MSNANVPVPDGQLVIIPTRPLTQEEELVMFQIAQDVCDKLLGEGTYVRINGFDPSKGETHKSELQGEIDLDVE